MSRPARTGEPKYFYPLIAIVISLIVVGVVEINILSADAKAAGAAVRDPRSLGHDLFDVAKYRALRRASRVARSSVSSSSSSSVSSEPVSSSSASSESSSSTSSSSESSSSSSVHAAASESAWTLEELSTSQRDTLRKQLRMNACPQDAATGYRLLCEKLLKEQGRPATRQGLKNPHQK